MTLILLVSMFGSNTGRRSLTKCCNTTDLDFELYHTFVTPGPCIYIDL
jgi:hypothetical protein